MYLQNENFHILAKSLIVVQHPQAILFFDLASKPVKDE